MPLEATYPPKDNGGSANTPKKREYVVAQHVAIFKEHALDDGSYLGPEGLQKIAENNNRRVQSTGDATPLIIGHTEDGQPEEEQPLIVGYATNFHVGPLFDTGQSALFADFHIDKAYLTPTDKYPHGMVNAFPRRSVEFWPGRLEVDPISLLGATTPQQDLGLLQFDRRNERVIHYSRSGVPTSRIVTRYIPRVVRHARTATRTCECTDRQCPRCNGGCRRVVNKRLYRRNKNDQSGVALCNGCAGDAVRTGKLSTRPISVKPQRNSRRQTMAGNSHPIYPASYGYAHTPQGYGPVQAPRPAAPSPVVGTPSYVPSRYAANGRVNGQANGNGVRRYAMGDGLETPADTGDQNAALVQSVINSAPMQEIIQGQQQTQQALQEIMQMLQSQQGGMGGQPGMGGDMGGAPQGGDIGGDEDGSLPPSDDMEGEPQPDGQQGAPDESARWMHEPHDTGTAQAHSGMPEQYGMGEGCDDEEPEQYGMDVLPNKYAQGFQQPPAHMMDESGNYTGMDNDDDQFLEGPPPRETPSHYGAYASATNGYIPSETSMNGNKRRFSRPAGGTQRPQQYSRTPSQYELYLRSIGGYRNPQTGTPAPMPSVVGQVAATDEAVRYSRLERTVKLQADQLREMTLDRVRYARAEHLRNLQLTHGIDMDVAEEVADTDALDDKAFAKHCDKIVKRYSRDHGVALSAVAPIRPAQGSDVKPAGAVANPNSGMPLEASMDSDTVKRYSRDLATTMMQLKPKHPDLDGQALEEKAREVLKVRYSRA